MKLIIDVPDDFYERTMSENGMSYTDAEVVVNAFYMGTPLPEGRWIPVSERLPEESGLYLVSMNRLGYPQRAIDGFVRERWERYGNAVLVRGVWERYGNAVLAWMPLPEPYKAESKDKK